MEPAQPRPTLLGRMFRISLIVKGLDGILEVVGGILLVLVWAVLKDHLWAYLWMIVFLLGFIGYQSYTLDVLLHRLGTAHRV